MSGRVYDPENTPIAGTMLIEASAGTGKTYALERMVARLIGRENQPLSIDNILVVTFTNSAAREMKERIRLILTRRSRETWRSSSERERYRNALTDFGRASILTIHSFCLMVLGTWPFEASAPFRQEMIPGNKLETEEAHTWLASLDASAIAPEILESAYRQAGSSTKLISEIVRELIGDGRPPGSVLLPDSEDIEAFNSFVSDSNNPEGRLSAAADSLFTPAWSSAALKAVFKAAGGANKTAASLNKICAHMAACRALKGIPALTDGILGDPAEAGIKSHFHELLHAAAGLNTDAGSLDGESSALLQALKDFLTIIAPYIEIRKEGREVKAVNLLDRYMRCIFYGLVRQKLKPRVDRRKDETGIWGYADLIQRVSQAVERPDSPLTRLLRTRYRAALIDEFQDTDPLQWQMFHSLFSGPGHILALIGDPKQCIYGFRGTGLQGYQAAKSLIPAEKQYRLETNFRSRASLAAVINRLFSPVFRTRCDGGRPIGFFPVESGRPAGDRFCYPHAEIPITIIKAASESEYADGIVREIRALLDPETGGQWISDSPIGETGTRDPSLSRRVLASDIAVLVRTVRQEEDFISRLTALEIPTLCYRSRSVFTQPICEAVYGLLRALDAPRNQALWRSVLLDEFFRLPPDLLLRLEQSGCLDHFSEKGMEWKRLFVSGKSFLAFESFFGYSIKLASWAEETGYAGSADHLRHPWTRRVISRSGGERLWQDWRQISELIQKKQSEGLRDIPGIIAWMRRCAQDQNLEKSEFLVRLETESPAVRVLTMHASKGLEFPLVFLHGGFTGKTKHSSRDSYRFDDRGTLVTDRLCRERYFNRHRANNWEEDKRLWYVAFTRAVYKLWAPFLSDEKRVVQMDSFWDIAISRTADPPDQFRLPPHESMDRKNAGGFKQQLCSKLDEFAENSDLMHLIDSGTSQPTPLPKPKPARQGPLCLAPLPSCPAGMRDPATESYTSLLLSLRRDSGYPVEQDKDVDHIIASSDDFLPEADNDTNPLGQDGGAIFGQLIHACLEQCDFSLAASDDKRIWFSHQDTEDLFNSLANRFYPPNWYESRSAALKTMVRRALRVSIPSLGRLCDLQPRQFRREIEFQVYLPQGTSLDVDSTEIRIDSGFLKGFIDLLLRKDGRWWVVDWKTNLLPSGRSYEDIMKENLYRLQYELYLIGLCRTLSGNLGRPIDWEKEIGGAAYLFLRGLDEQSEDGIWTSKPTRRHILGIAKAMGCFEAIK